MTSARRARRAAGWAAVLAAAACANIQAPPGGPEDKAAPQLLATRPDTMARLEGWTGPVVFVFDEPLSEQGVEEAVSLSPVRGRVAVDKEGDEIRVQPRQGWQRGQIYHVELAPGLRDRFGNVRGERTRLVFSTGPDIPATAASGAVFERVTGNPAIQGRVDIIRAGDSLTYTTRTDSAGRFTFRQVPEGDYQVLAWRDANRNGRVDPFEQRDTARLAIAVGQTPSATLATLLPDTTPPRPASARVTEGWIEVRFDDFLDPEQPLGVGQVTVVGPGGAAVALAEIRVGVPEAARDTARADTADIDADTAGANRRPISPVVGDSARADSVRRDTTPRLAGPRPSQSLSVRPAAPLLADTLFQVRVDNVRNVNGLVGGGEVPLRTPRPAPPRAAPARDTAGARPAGTRPDPASLRPPAPGATPSATPPPGTTPTVTTVPATPPPAVTTVPATPAPTTAPATTPPTTTSTTPTTPRVTTPTTGTPATPPPPPRPPAPSRPPEAGAHD